MKEEESRAVVNGTSVQLSLPIAEVLAEVEDSLESVAGKAGLLIIRALLEDGGRAQIYHPLFNYLPGDLSLVREMMDHPHTVMGLSDGGAHCGTICDASFPTTVLQHWGRDRSRGPGFPIEDLIRKQTSETAALVGLEGDYLLAGSMDLLVQPSR